EDAADILYSTIEKIGRERIRIDIASSIDFSEKHSRQILRECLTKLGSKADDETLASICETLLHFMLTAAILPSERKVSFSGAELDIVIPSLKTLAKNPDKSLVIQITKKENDVPKIVQAESVQPVRENIWIVSSRPLVTRYRNYHLFQDGMSYHRIMRDIHDFVKSNGVRGLNLLHG
ncbi:MAG: hypothetical protein ACREBU_23545, partial [Nitrososphaera sp.]